VDIAVAEVPEEDGTGARFGDRGAHAVKKGREPVERHADVELLRDAVGRDRRRVRLAQAPQAVAVASIRADDHRIHVAERLGEPLVTSVRPASSRMT
jgi:hypothetical protein